MFDYSTPFSRQNFGQPAMNHGLGYNHRREMMRPQLGRPSFPSFMQPSYQQPQQLGQPSVQSIAPPATQSQPSSVAPSVESSQPQQSVSSLIQSGLGSGGLGQPLDPFGTQASGRQYGNLSGTPAIFGASDYGQYQSQGSLNTSPEAQAILARIRPASSGPVDFAAENAYADSVRSQYAAGNSVPGHAQLQPGQIVGGNQWNGTAWVPRNY